jgi:hypothetical protein
MNARRPRYTYPWVGAATWAAATIIATIITVRTPSDVLSWGRQGSSPTVFQRDDLAAAGPGLIGIGGAIVLIAFIVRTVLTKRFPPLEVPVRFRALRADAGIVAIAAVAFLLLYLARTITATGELNANQVVTAIQILAAGLTFAGVLHALGVWTGLAHDHPQYVPHLIAGAGLAGAGILTLAASATDSLTAALITAVISLAAAAFTSLVLSIRNLTRHEREHPPGAPQ